MEVDSYSKSPGLLSCIIDNKGIQKGFVFGTVHQATWEMQLRLGLLGNIQLGPFGAIQNRVTHLMIEMDDSQLDETHRLLEVFDSETRKVCIQSLQTETKEKLERVCLGLERTFDQLLRKVRKKQSKKVLAEINQELLKTTIFESEEQRDAVRRHQEQMLGN